MMTITDKKKIEVTTISSVNKKFRFYYERLWDTNKPKVLIILMNPSKGSSLLQDNTIGNINNFCVNQEYGSFILCNLFPLMATDPKDLSFNLDLQKKENIKQIKSAITKVEKIIIAWGVENKYLKRKKEIEKILAESGFPMLNIMCWTDNGKYPKHPRIPVEGWTFTNYDFKHFKK